MINSDNDNGRDKEKKKIRIAPESNFWKVDNWLFSLIKDWILKKWNQID